MTLAYVVLPTTIQQKKPSDQKHSDIRQDTVLYDSIKMNSICPVGEGDYFNCQRGQKLNAVINLLFRILFFTWKLFLSIQKILTFIHQIQLL